MAEEMQKEWIVPVLQDIEDFLVEHGLPDMAAELRKLVEKYRDELVDPPEP